MANLENKKNIFKSKINEALNKNKNIICITDSDADGILCGTLFRIQLKDSIDIMLSSAAEVDQLLENIKLSSDSLYIFSDLCPKNLKALEGLNYMVVDHHFTTPEGEWIIKDTRRAACELLFWLLDEPEEVKNYVAAIAAADIFRKEDICKFETGRDLYSYIMSHPVESRMAVMAIHIKVFNYALDNKKYVSVVANAITERKLLEIAAESEEDKYSQNSLMAMKAFREAKENKEYLEINTPYGICILIKDTPYLSDMAFAWLKEEPEKYLVAKTKYGTLTLRGAVGGINVGLIAQQHGGGGHAAAAGIPKQIQGETLEEIAESIKELLG